MSKPILLVAGCVTLLLAACGSNGSEPGSVDVERTAVFAADQGDYGQATFEQTEARLRWDAADISEYTMQVGYQTMGHVEVVIVDGSSVSESTFGDDGSGWPALPRTVSEALDQIDEMLTAAAANDVAPDGDCAASYFIIRWDPDFGFPTYYDGLGPCDDGVGIEITIEASGARS